MTDTITTDPAADTTPTTTLNAHHLARLLRTVRPHTGRDTIPALHGVRLESDGRWLYAIATDRYTMAITRARLRTPAPAWGRTVHTPDVEALRAWIDTHSPEDDLTIEPCADGELTFTGSRGALRFATDTDLVFPKWRGLIRGVLTSTPGAPARFASWTSHLLERWGDAGYSVKTWQPEDGRPMLVTAGPDFIGLQMPLRQNEELGDAVETPAAVLERWADSLDPETAGEELDWREALPAEPEDGVIRRVPQMVETLLRQTMASTSDVFHAPSGDPGAMAAYVAAGVHSWIGYRVLAALRRTDPDLAAQVVADLGEQLDSGEIGEWAWEAATAEGYDPEVWVAEAQERRAKRLEEKAAKEKGPEAQQAPAES